MKVTAPSRKAFNGKIELDSPEVEFEVCLNPSSGSYEQKPLRVIEPGEASADADVQPVEKEAAATSAEATPAE